jgi:hypothetical protein
MPDALVQQAYLTLWSVTTHCLLLLPALVALTGLMDYRFLVFLQPYRNCLQIALLIGCIQLDSDS